MKKLIIISLIVSLVLPGFGSTGSPRVVLAQELPENLEDFKNIGQRILDSILGALKRVWEEAVGIWKKVIGWIVNIWKSYIFPFLKFIWQKIWNFCLWVIKMIWEKIVKIVFEKIKGMIK